MRRLVMFGLVVAASAAVVAQTLVDVHRGKVQIRSNAADALAVTGGITSASVTASSFVQTLGNDPIVQWVDSDAAADNKNYRAYVQGSSWKLQAFNDAGSTINDILTVTRSGATVTGIALGGGQSFVKVLSSSTTWDPSLINANDTTSITMTMTGITNTSTCFASLSSWSYPTVVVWAHYDSSNTVRVMLSNTSNSSSFDPSTGTVRATCFVY